MYKKIFLNLLIVPSFLLSFSVLFSQQTKFQRTYGTTNSEYIQGASPTSDGGYIMCLSVDYPSDPKCALMKTDSAGNTQWTKTYTKPNYTSSGGPVIQTLDGGYLFRIGFSKTNFDHVCLIKTDSNGDTVWVKCGLGGRFIQNKDSTYVMGAMGIIKFNTKGDILWWKGFPGGDGGGDFNVTSDKGYIAFGVTKKYAIGGPGDYDFYLVKSDSLCNMQWNKTYGITGGLYGEGLAWGISAGRSVIETQDGGYIMTAITDAKGAGDWDIAVIKTDSAGNLQWANTYGGTNQDNSTSIRQIPGNVGYILTGLTFGGAESTTPQNSERTFLAKLDLSGNITWSMMYGSVLTNPLNAGDYGFATSIVYGPNGGYMFAGYREDGTASSDLWFVKTDPSGISGCNEKPLVLTTLALPLIVGSGGSDTTYSFVPQTDSIIYIGTWQHTDSILCPVAPLGVQAISNTEDEISIYPNPTAGKFTVQTQNLKINNIEIYNTIGEKAYSISNLNKTSVEINILKEPEGIYFVRVKSEKGIISKKVVLVK